MCNVVDNERLSPKMKFAFAEENIILDCKSRTLASWYFYDRGGLIPIGESKYFSQNLLHLTNVRSENNGYYECQGTTGKDLKFAAKMWLIVLGKFGIIYTQFMLVVY